MAMKSTGKFEIIIKGVRHVFPVGPCGYVPKKGKLIYKEEEEPKK